jgi:hypothetical protein
MKRDIQKQNKFLEEFKFTSQKLKYNDIFDDYSKNKIYIE